jgi:quercetin dioxygenase-like cupin family protein
MKHLAFAVAIGLLAALPAAAQNMASPVIVTPSQVVWNTNDALPPGVKIATMEGDFTKPGWYTVRLHFDDGAKFPPHFHGSNEYVTVLSGTLLVGLGDKMDTAKMTPLPAGSYAGIPATVHHYAMAQGETVVQVSGPGPMTQTILK